MNKKWISPNFANFLYLQMYFLGWVYCVGRSSSILPNSRILTENPTAGKAGCKNSAKSELGELTSMKKYAQLLLIAHIRQSQNFDKSSYWLLTDSHPSSKPGQSANAHDKLSTTYIDTIEDPPNSASKISRFAAPMTFHNTWQ